MKEIKQFDYAPVLLLLLFGTHNNNYVSDGYMCGGHRHTRPYARCSLQLFSNMFVPECREMAVTMFSAL